MGQGPYSATAMTSLLLVPLLSILALGAATIMVWPRHRKRGYLVMGAGIAALCLPLALGPALGWGRWWTTLVLPLGMGTSLLATALGFRLILPMKPAWTFLHSICTGLFVLATGLAMTFGAGTNLVLIGCNLLAAVLTWDLARLVPLRKLQYPPLTLTTLLRPSAHLVSAIALVTPWSIPGSIAMVMTGLITLFWHLLVLLVDGMQAEQELDLGIRRLRKLALTDELTGLHNRAALDNRLRAEMARAVRYVHPLSVILLDIDHFKLINDVHGHQKGDEVLVLVTHHCRHLVREPDNMYRWGGEEFLMIAPHTNLAGALVMAEKLRVAVEAMRLEGVPPVTISCGVADWKTGEPEDSLFKRVDQALYRAKNNGRNRVEAWSRDHNLPIALVRLQWQATWNSGNDTIDAEHRHLLDLANTLLDLANNGEDGPQLSRILGDFLDHTTEHFAHEEAIMADQAYPGLDQHRTLHRELLDQAAELSRQHQAGRLQAVDLFGFLVYSIFYDHVNSADRQYFAYARTRFRQ